LTVRLGRWGSTERKTGLSRDFLITRRQLSGVKLRVMSTVFAKLNFKDHKQIVVLDSPGSFESELAALKGVEIIRDLKKVRGNVSPWRS
jgi:hypothetical protein